MKTKFWRRFKLHGTTYTVRVVDAEQWKEDPTTLGTFSPQGAEVFIRSGNPQVMQHTLCHELVHAILTAMGEDKLSEDEKFVDTFGGLLHQALTTAE